MPRIRHIKPEFFLDEDLAALEPLDRLAFIGLWCYADKAGRLEDRPQRLALQILPYEAKSFADRLDRLNQSGFIIRYTVENKAFIQIRTWAKHQKPHHTERPSVIPPPEHGEITVKKPCDNDTETVREQEGRGKGRGKGYYTSLTSLPPSPGTCKPRTLVAAITTEWLNGLKTNPAYVGINFDVEIGKCRAWCELHKRAFSQRRFLNWLNRARADYSMPNTDIPEQIQDVSSDDRRKLEWDRRVTASGHPELVGRYPWLMSEEEYRKYQEDYA